MGGGLGLGGGRVYVRCKSISERMEENKRALKKSTKTRGSRFC